MRTVHLMIRGNVQGVFYRASAKEIADELGVRGWIRNTSSGDVEAVVSGEYETVSNFIEWCKSGPQHAKVKNVEIIEMEEERFADFRIAR